MTPNQGSNIRPLFSSESQAPASWTKGPLPPNATLKSEVSRGQHRRSVGEVGGPHLWAYIAQVACQGADLDLPYLNGASLGWGKKKVEESCLGLHETNRERETPRETSVLKESNRGPLLSGLTLAWHCSGLACTGPCRSIPGLLNRHHDPTHYHTGLSNTHELAQEGSGKGQRELFSSPGQGPHPHLPEIHAWLFCLFVLQPASMQ